MSTQNADGVLRRSSRRLRYRSRSAAVSTALVLAALIGLYLAVEAGLALAGRPALVATPAQLWDTAQAQPAIAWVAAVVLAVIGVVFVLLAVLPGRLARREVSEERFTVVLDDDVLASGLSRSAATAAGVGRSQVRTAVGHRRARVQLTPTTGFPPARDAAQQASVATVTALGLRPGLTPRVTVEREGVIA
ncbi:DUF6286 domain-containing protein [Microbacterium sp. 10M-3C3]|jgi:hypothetical protein|uniref:DUF6286 domain-containing protein n=1 Tax=Microbacterium sp. 10M-3C3 TaxID=2483401 RepID=UPI000F62D2D7|nr:DUF6286 domain-containing protein [Microbacterium sp. 10M-3C3]